jgi:hypothetical protein
MASSNLQRILKPIAWILGIIFFLLMATLTRVDRSPLSNNAFYHETLAAIDTTDFSPVTGNGWKVGWGKTNATPQQAANLVGYKSRGKYQFVQDSSFVRSLLISNGQATVAILNFELMIIHPHLYNQVKDGLKKANMPVDYLFFTATHTHSGFGGYMPGLVGKLAFGGFDKEIVEMLVSSSLNSINQALANSEIAEISFQKIATDTLVANRLIADDPVDPDIRMLRFITENGKKGSFITFNGHPTILASDFMGLSGDFPHYLMEMLEEHEDFAMYAAGTVGSHRPVVSGNQPKDALGYAQALFGHIEKAGEENVEEVLSHELALDQVQMKLRAPHLRISEKTRIRPWIFTALVGETNNHLDRIQIGNTLLIGSSAELSGVFMPRWEAHANGSGMNLLVTCFNGGYIGYITPDAYYDLPLYEAKDMNWFGPYNGDYFDQVMKLLITPKSK